MIANVKKRNLFLRENLLWRPHFAQAALSAGNILLVSCSDYWSENIRPSSLDCRFRVPPRTIPFTIMFSWSHITKAKISGCFQEKGVCQTSNTADRGKTCHSWDVHRVWLSTLFINIPLKFVEKCIQSRVITMRGEKAQKCMQNSSEVQWIWWLFIWYFYSVWFHFTEKRVLMHVKWEQTH